MFNNRGVAYERSKLYAQAIADFEESIQLWPYRASTYVNRGDAYAATSQFQNALADYNSALKLDPRARGIHAARARLYLRLGYYYLALDDLDRSVARGQDDALLLAERCEARARLKRDLARALSDCNTALRLKPRDPLALHARGLAEAALGRYDLAIADFSDVLGSAPASEGVLVDRAAAYAALRQYEHAGADYNGALGLVPDDPAAREGICWLGALTATDLDAALAYCSDILKGDPSDQNALDSRGFIELRMARYGDAVRDYDARLRLTPGSASSLYGRGLARSRLRNPAGAADLSRARALDPAIADVYLGAGLKPDSGSDLGLRPSY